MKAPLPAKAAAAIERLVATEAERAAAEHATSARAARAELAALPADPPEAAPLDRRAVALSKRAERLNDELRDCQRELGRVRLEALALREAHGARLRALRSRLVAADELARAVTRLEEELARFERKYSGALRTAVARARAGGGVVLRRARGTLEDFRIGALAAPEDLGAWIDEQVDAAHRAGDAAAVAVEQAEAAARRRRGW